MCPRMDNTRPRLSIITTLDPRPGTMAAFHRDFLLFAESNGSIELVVVNGFGPLHDAIPPASIFRDTANIRMANSPLPGQGNAFLHGASIAKGEILVSIDPDMHGNIHDISTLLACHQRGDQLVYTRRRHRHDAGLARRAASHLFNICLSLVTGTRVHDFNSPMFLISRDALNVLLPLRLPAEAYKFHAYYLNHTRFSQIDIDVSGVLKKKSNYEFRTLLRLFFARLSLACRYRNFPEG